MAVFGLEFFHYVMSLGQVHVMPWRAVVEHCRVIRTGGLASTTGRSVLDEVFE